MSEGFSRRGAIPEQQSRSPQKVRRPRRTIGQKLLLMMGSLSTVFLLLVAGVLFWANQVLGNVQTIPVDGLSESKGGVSNWLLVGTDSREGIDESDPNAGAFLDGEVGGRRTDTIMIARVDTNNSTVRLLSVPRDLWVDIPGSGEDRVNASFTGENGPARLVETIELNLGIEINQYAEVNFVGFQDVIDALGGVPMYFETPVRDPNTGLNIKTAGCHTLDGEQALAFARTRKLEYYEDGEWDRLGQSSDLERAARQRYFLARVADATASKANLFDAGEFNNVANAAGQNLQVSSGTGTTDLLNLARTFRNVGSEGVESYSLPVVDQRIEGKAVVVLQVEEAQPVLDLFRNAEELPEGTVGKASFTTSVLNGSGTQGQASSAGTALESQGFKVGEVGDASLEVSTSVIRYGPGQEAEAKTVATFVDSDVEFEADSDIDGVVLVTGSGFRGIRTEPVDVDGPAPSADSPPAAGGDNGDSETVIEEDDAGEVLADGDRASECKA